MSAMNKEAAQTGTLLRIERTSIHDGQGLRTVLFLKGCPLNCAWCSTPESQQFAPERGYLGSLCTACGKCIETCPAAALSLTADSSTITIDHTQCKRCFTCVGSCPNRAIKKYGYAISTAEAVREVAKDEIFYFHSQGGITLSGGEPLSQPGFVAVVLQESKKLGIHTAIESCFHIDFENIEKALPWLDVLYVDIKHMDSRQHKQWTGADNALILENIRRTDRSAYPLEIIVRVPLIPGVNDSPKNLQTTLEFCKNLTKIKEIELLPYHRLGVDTYKHLGKKYTCVLGPQAADQIAKQAAYLKGLHSGIPIKIGSGF